MADNTPQTSVNSELISAGLNPNSPATTSVDFANQLARARQDQEAQEQAIARAKELTAQSTMQTQEQQEAKAAGLNTQLGNYMTPEAAVATVRLLLKEKGLPIDEDELAAWQATLPAQVNRQIVEEFANRFAKPTTRAGQAGMFTTDANILVPAGKSAAEIGLTDMHDAAGNSVDDKTKSDGTFVAHVPEDGMYQAEVDNTGALVRYTPGGKEATDNSAKGEQKQAQFDAKRWSDLENRLTTVIKSSRGNQLSSAIFRADRALNELADPQVLIPQVLDYIGKDLGGIFQGGVPPVTGSEKEEFETAFQGLNRFVQRYTGMTAFFRTDLGNQRQTLIGLVTRLRESTLDVIEAMLNSSLEGFRDIIDKDSDRYQRLVASKLGAISGGLSATASDQATRNAMPTTIQPLPGVKSKKAPAAPAAPAAGDASNPLNLKGL